MGGRASTDCAPTIDIYYYIQYTTAYLVVTNAIRGEVDRRETNDENKRH